MASRRTTRPQRTFAQRQPLPDPFLNMSSLFGNLGASQPAAGASNSTPALGSLFSKPAGTATGTTTTPSLFGNLGGATSNTSTATTQPASSGGLGGGLFGGALGGAKPAAPASTSTPSLGLFGAASTSQPPAQTTGGGLFAGLGGNAQQSSAPASNTQQTNSLFGNTTTQQQQQQPQQQQSAPLAQSTAGTTRSAHFDHLLERGRKRNAGENGIASFDELPSLQLGLGDIARKVRNLGSGGPSADQVQDRAQDRAA
jgi:nuclear pore complex protein Nup93